MRWNHVVRACVVSGLVGLAACAPWSVKWSPHSATQKGNQIARTCVQFFQGDAEAIADAGGRYHGQMVIAVNSGWMEINDHETLDAGRDKAAERGGTHCLVVRDDEWDETKGLLVQTWGSNMASVRPVTEHRHTVALVVFRVPYAKWKELPPALVPPPL